MELTITFIPTLIMIPRRTYFKNFFHSSFTVKTLAISARFELLSMPIPLRPNLFATASMASLSFALRSTVSLFLRSVYAARPTWFMYESGSGASRRLCVSSTVTQAASTKVAQLKILMSQVFNIQPKKSAYQKSLHHLQGIIWGRNQAVIGQVAELGRKNSPSHQNAVHCRRRPGHRLGAGIIFVVVMLTHGEVLSETKRTRSYTTVGSPGTMNFC